jgi:hypothetical protein
MEHFSLIYPPALVRKAVDYARSSSGETYDGPMWE